MDQAKIEFQASLYQYFLNSTILTDNNSTTGFEKKSQELAISRYDVSFSTTVYVLLTAFGSVEKEVNKLINSNSSTLQDCGQHFLLFFLLLLFQASGLPDPVSRPDFGKGDPI